MNKIGIYVCLILCLACSKTNVNQSGLEQFFTIQVLSVEEAKEFYNWTEDRIPLVSAHRGGAYPGFPENSIEAFANTLRHTPSIIEFDVAITLDSVLVLMHDNTLDRTTTGKGKVAEHTYAQLQELYLVDKAGNTTSFKIPTLQEALTWAKGKALLTVDVKKEVPFHMVVKAIEKEDAAPYAAVITYSLQAAQEVHKLNPNLMLSVTIRNEEELSKFLSSGIPVENAIAFTGTAERDPGFNDLLHEKGIFTILGVLGNLDKMAVSKGDQVYADFVSKGADILATDRPIEAAQILQSLVPSNSSKQRFFDHKLSR
jgi:glycerophosphoryl diester phosphodiesterase